MALTPLSTLDAQFLAIETSRTYGHVGSIAVYDPTTAPGEGLTVESLRDLVQERLHLMGAYSRKLVTVPLGLDLPSWIEDPDFDLEFHIRESAVPPPGDERQLAETVARIFARPLDRSRPLWEIYLIYGLQGGKVGILNKVHHAVADGVSSAEVLTTLLDPSPEGREIVPPEKTPRPDRKPSELEMLGRALLGLPGQPLRALRAIPSALPNLTEVPGANAFPGVPTISRGLERARRLAGGKPTADGVLEVTSARPPRTLFNGPISAHRRFAYGSLPLSSFKALKGELGITVNDVVVALCATAVRDWLLVRDALPAEPLVAMVPVSVRQEGEREEFGNRIGAMIVPIPTNEPDPRRRLLRTHELLRSAKEHHAALPASLLTDATAFVPPAVHARAARLAVQVLGRTRPPVNLVISNVPGPREALFLAGAKLEALYPVSVVVDGVGLNITVLSYRDHVDFGVIADRDQVDDVWAIMDGLRDALGVFEELAGITREPTEAERAVREAARREVEAAAAHA